MRIVINFYLTWNCNFRCAHCIHECGPGQKHMTTEQLDYAFGFLKWLKEHNHPVVVCGLTGGEPLTHPNFWSYVMPGLIPFRKDGMDNVELHTNASIPIDDYYKCMYHRFFSRAFVGHDMFHREFKAVNELHLDDYSYVADNVLLRRNQYFVAGRPTTYVNKKGRGATLVEGGKYEELEGQPAVPNCIWIKYKPETLNVAFTPDHVNHCGEKSHPLSNPLKPTGQYHAYGMDYSDLLHAALDYPTKYCGENCSEPCVARMIAEKRKILTREEASAKVAVEIA